MALFVIEIVFRGEAEALQRPALGVERVPGKMNLLETGQEERL